MTAPITISEELYNLGIIHKPSSNPNSGRRDLFTFDGRYLGSVDAGGAVEIIARFGDES